jgi:hypothetical protein
LGQEQIAAWGDLKRLLMPYQHAAIEQRLVDTPHVLKSGGFSALRGCLRNLSPTGLPGPFYVLGGVMVTVQACTAARADLARVGRVHRYDPPTGACCLEGEDAQKLRPSGVLNGLGQMMVLEHVGDLQILMIDCIETPHQMQRGFLLEILPLTPHLEMRFGKQLHCFAPTVAPLLAASHAALSRFEATLRPAIAARVMNHRAIGERSKRFQAEVYSRFLSR